MFLLLSIPTKRVVVVVQAEARAEFAEKTVKKLQKEVDRLEGLLSDPCSIITTHYLGVDCTTCTRLLGNNNALLHSRRGHLDISACSYYFPQLSRRVHHFNSPPNFYFIFSFICFQKLKKVILCTVLLLEYLQMKLAKQKLFYEYHNIVKDRL